MADRTKVPNALPVQGRITSNFGNREDPMSHNTAQHSGIDIAAKYGTPISSTIAGKVIEAGKQGSYGNTVRVQAADGTVITLAHMSSIAVKKGQQVSAGQVVGRVGSTGKSTGNHVHYEVRDRNNQLVDPLTGNTSAVASPQSSAVRSGPTLSVDAQAKLRADLDRDGGYYPNPLNFFHNYNYHIKFFMVSPETFQQKLGRIGDATPEHVASILDNATKVVIAETGVTAGINVKSLTYKAYKTESNSDAGGDFELVLVEPLGTSFYDATVNASNLLGIKDFKDTPYYIEISFSGYDEQGNIVENILIDPPMADNGDVAAPLPNNGRWFWQVLLQTVDTSITPQGSLHTIKLNSNIIDGAAGSDGKLVPEMMQVCGRTVGEFLTNFKDQLEKSQERRYGTSKGKLITYDFSISPNDAVPLNSDPTSWSLVDEEEMFTDKGILTMDGDHKPTMQIAPGMRIDSIINTLFGNTKEAQRLAANGVPTQNDTIDGAPQARAQILPTIRVDVSIGDYNDTWGQYAKNYNYRITPSYRTTGFVDQRQQQEMGNPVVQKDMIKKLREKGFFRKRFDYLYTGNNTEIVNFDVKFQVAWSAVLPNVIGYSVSHSQVASNDRYNENAFRDKRQIAAEYAALDNQKQIAQKELTSLISNVSGIKTQSLQIRDGLVSLNTGAITDVAQRTALDTALTRVNAFNEPLAQKRAELIAAERRSPEQDAKATRGGNTYYAEELTDPIAPPPQLRLIQSQANTQTDKIGMSEPYHRDRAIFGALMEQLVGEQASLMEIDLEVRGDPYWMGSANIESSPQPTSGAGVSPTDYGEVLFLLKVSYPFSASSDIDDGSPNFRSFDDDYRKDQFTGFYRVSQVENIFSDGQFRQRITAFRHPMLSVANYLDYGNAEGELDSSVLKRAYEGNDPLSIIPNGETGNFTPTGALPTTTEQRHTQQTIYTALRAKGWTDEAALVAVAEIGRENDYNPASMFGTHTDAANKKTNIGIVSWQGTRGPEFKNYMAARGYIQPDGSIVRSDAALKAQAEYIDFEMKKSYPQVYTSVRNPDLGYSNLEPLLSEKYFGWDRRGSSIGANTASSHRQKMSGYYASAKDNLKR